VGRGSVLARAHCCRSFCPRHSTRLNHQGPVAASDILLSGGPAVIEPQARQSFLREIEYTCACKCWQTELYPDGDDTHSVLIRDFRDVGSLEIHSAGFR
jgi:hypothetical protein